MSRIEELRACADTVEWGCGALSVGSPAALDRCSGALESAVERLTALESGLTGTCPNAEVLEEAWRLRRSIRRASALLENAAAYHRGWSAVVAVKTAGYGPGGVPGDVIPSRHVWVEG
jgi:hypothetical protein